MCRLIIVMGILLMYQLEILQTQYIIGMLLIIHNKHYIRQ